MLQVVSRSFQRELSSATNSYLLANQFGKITFKTTIDVYWNFIVAQYSNQIAWDGVSVITREYGDFTKDEFSIGDSINIYMYRDSPAILWTATAVILSLNAKEMTLTTIVDTSGTMPSAFGYTPYVYATIDGTTALNSLRYSFGLIENNEPTNYISKLDQNEQTYICENLAGGSQQTAQVQGYASWNTGTFKVKKVSHPTSTVRQRFEIEQVFIINPFYIQGSDIDNSPEWLANTNSLRMVCKYEAKPELYNPNSTHGGVDEILKGDVGYLNENYNAIIRADGSVFSIDSIVLTKNSVVVNEIDLSDTHVVMTISSSNNVFSSGNSKFVLTHTMLNDDASTYTNTATSQLDNFLHCRILQTSGATGGTGSLGILTNVKSSVVATKLIVEFDLAYTSIQQSKVGTNQILLTLETQDHLKTADNNDAMVLYDYFDVSTSADDASLLTWEDVRHFELPFDYSTNPIMGRKEVKLWLCDSVWTRAEFTTNDSKLNKVELLYRVVSNAGDIQELTSVIYDISANVVIGNIRQVDVENIRGYILPSNDNRNDFNLTMLSGETAPNQRYLFEIGTKLRWEDWIKLLNIDTDFQDDFFDISELQNNINQKWDKYKDDANWSMQLVIRCTCEDSLGATTIFENTSDVEVYDFDKDENTPPRWTCEIELFDGATSLGTDNNAVIAPSNNTLMVATFNCSPFTLDTASLYGVLYLEEYQKGGEFKQVQINSLDAPKSNIALIPISGETKAKLTIVDTQNVTVECLIDKSKINSDSVYSLTARIGSTCIDTDTDEGFTQEFLYPNNIQPSYLSMTFSGNNSLVLSQTNTIFVKDFFISDDNCKTYTTWNIESDYNDVSRYFVQFYNGYYYFLIGRGSPIIYEHILIKTADFNTLILISTITESYLDNFILKDESNMLYSTNDKIKKSVDGGINWTQILSTGDGYGEILWYDDNIIVNCDNNGRIHKSSNNGTSFSQIVIDPLYVLTNNLVSALRLDSSGVLYNIVENSSLGRYRLYKSLDNGTTWTFIYEFTKRVRDIQEYDGVLYVSLFPNYCQYSIDGGATFSQLLDINGSAIKYGIFYFDGDDLIILTDNRIYRYTGGYIPCEIIKDIDGFVLQEDGSFLLQENNDKLILEL